MAENSPHESFWDCIENGVYQVIERFNTPNAECDQIEINRCTECRRKFVCEQWLDNGVTVEDFNHYGLKDPFETSNTEIIKEYL